jgi:DNA-binding transcriptional ArsR family regulator
MTIHNEIKPAERIVLDSLDALKVYFNPMRLKIIHEMVNTPKTVQEIANALGVPFTRLYYHINLLEKHNIIHVVETRSMSGAVEEKYYQVAAYQFIVPNKLLSFSNPEEAEGINLFLSKMLGETSDDIRLSIHTERINMEVKSPHPDSLLVRRGLMRMSREKIEEFHQDLHELMKKYRDEEAQADDIYYGFTVALYPSALPYSESEDEES